MQYFSVPAVLFFSIHIVSYRMFTMLYFGDCTVKFVFLKLLFKLNIDVGTHF